MKVALVHDYLTQRGGAERVFELLCKYFPNADIFTSLYDAKETIDLGNRQVNTTFLQHIPYASRYFRLLAPFYYPAFRALDLQEYGLIISSSSSFAKGVKKRPDAQHICFCHNITRFLWDTQVYLRGYKEFQLFAPAIDKVFTYMRGLDVKYSKEPDLYIANSTTVANRIQHIYDKPAITLNYPIDETKFIFSERKEDFYLVCCRLLSYKRVDIIVEAFNSLGWPLTIVGEGPERKRLEAKARENIRFLGQVSDFNRTQLMANARAVLVAALEDYGLVPIEANFSGTPVIAYGAGGVLDTQVPGVTGVFFDRQTPEAVREAAIAASQIEWNPVMIRDHARERFTEAVFFEKVGQLLDLVRSSNVEDLDRQSIDPSERGMDRQVAPYPPADDVGASELSFASQDVANQQVPTSSPADDDVDSSELSFVSQEVAAARQVPTSSSAQNLDYTNLSVDRQKVPTSSQSENSAGYGQLFAVLLRRKYWFLASFLGSIGIALLLSLYLKPTYRSSMQLLVEQNYQGTPEQESTAPQFADSDVKVDFATQLTLMNSSGLLQQIVDHLRPIYPQLKLEEIKKSLSVAQITGKNAEKKVDTKIFEAAYENRDPVKAQKVLQTVQQVYQDYNREQQKLRLARGLVFINEQIPQIQARLKQAESALENFRKTHNFIDPELQSKALVESLGNIVKEQHATSVQIQDLSTQHAVLEQKLALSPQASSQATRLSQSSRYQNLLNEIQKTELALVQERLRFTDRSGFVQKLLEQQRQQQSQLSIEMQRILPDLNVSASLVDAAAVMKTGQLGSNELTLASQFINIQVNLRAAQARAQTLKRIEKQYQQEIQRFPAVLAEYNRLQPAVHVTRETLQQLLKSRQDLGLEIARGGFDWQVVEKPQLGKKIGPDLKRNLLLGAVVGLFLGGITAFLRDTMDDSIHSIEELKKQTNLPLLGAVPKMLMQGSSKSGISLPLRYVSTLTPSNQQVNWLPLRESIDLAYKNIQLLDSAKVLKSLAVTSVLAGEGKSTVAIGLAMSAARLHKRVLLIDADLRCPSLHTKLDLFNGEGLSTLLSSNPKISSKLAIQSLSMNSTLDILTAGPMHLDPARLLSSRRMTELMLEFEANYDLVLLDTPPILGIVDTVIVASFCSGVVLVERLGRVNRKDLTEAAAVMNRLNVVGLISNGGPHSTERYAVSRQRIDRETNF